MVMPLVEHPRVAGAQRGGLPIRSDYFDRRGHVPAHVHFVLALAEVDNDLIHARRRFAKIIGKAEDPVLRRGTNDKGVVVVALAMQLHGGAVHDDGRKESAIFQNFKILLRRFAGLVVLHVIRIGM
jgi:hypothetical protein